MDLICDGYKCSACHRRFRKNQMACPFCEAGFAEQVTDEEEFIFEEDEPEEWNGEDSI